MTDAELPSFDSPIMWELWKAPEVSRRTGLGHSALYAAMGAGRFPKPVQVGGRVAWRSADVIRWMATLGPGVKPGVDARDVA